MTLEEASKLKIDDYVYYYFEDHYYVGFVTKEIHGLFENKPYEEGNETPFLKIYSELSIDNSEWELDDVPISIRDIYQKLELETLIDQLKRKYSSLLI